MTVLIFIYVQCPCLVVWFWKMNTLKIMTWFELNIYIDNASERKKKVLKVQQNNSTMVVLIEYFFLENCFDLGSDFDSQSLKGTGRPKSSYFQLFLFFT